jgi:predicted HicB family RNase H-like nuclease
MLNYKGYYGSINASVEDNCLYGKLEFISALINYEGTTVEALKGAFEAAVDDYLATCSSQSISAEKPCKGSFNVRIGHKLHLSAMLAAKQQNISLNDFVKQQIANGIK